MIYFTILYCILWCIIIKYQISYHIASCQQNYIVLYDTMSYHKIQNNIFLCMIQNIVYFMIRYCTIYWYNIVWNHKYIIYYFLVYMTLWYCTGISFTVLCCAIVCDFNDKIWDFNALLWHLYAMLLEIEMNDYMIWYAMLWYVLRFEQKRLQTQSTKHFEEKWQKPKVELIM